MIEFVEALETENPTTQVVSDPRVWNAAIDKAAEAARVVGQKCRPSPKVRESVRMANAIADRILELKRPAGPLPEFDGFS